VHLKGVEEMNGIATAIGYLVLAMGLVGSLMFVYEKIMGWLKNVQKT
jgi:hypothetical protein